MKSLVNGRWRSVSKLLAQSLVASTAFGRGAFTTLGLRHGQALFLDLHLARLRDNARHLDIPWCGERVIRQRLREGRSRNRISDAVLRIVVCRYKSSTELSLLYEPPRVTPAAATLMLTEIDRRVRAHVKSTDYPFWHSFHAQARKGNCFDVLAHANGWMLESSLANVFFVTGRGTITPPAHDCILPGIARQELLKNKEPGVLQRPIRLVSLQSVDAIFCTNSVRGVIPIGRIVHPRGALVWRGDVDRVKPFQQAWKRLVRTQTEQI